MEVYVKWGAIGVLVLFLLVGLVCGLIRGLKRSSLHLLFFIASAVLAYFITKPITNAVLQININIGGTTQSISAYIVALVQESFDLSGLSSAEAFLQKLPTAVASPIIFLVLMFVCYAIFDIIYLIVARIAFGKKKKDFEKHKPYRAYGSLIGMFEGFLVLFLAFAPLTSLTNTYVEICEYSQSQEEDTSVQTAEESKKQKTIGETLQELLPAEVNEIIFAYNNSAVGKISGAGGIDNALFDGLSNFKMNGEKIEFRKEIVSLANIYDDVIVTFNNIQDQNYTDIDLTKLKTNLESFLNDGLFKQVVATTVEDLVNKFDQIKENWGMTELPELAEDIIDDLQLRFATQGFDVAEYLKADLLKLVDIAQNVFDNKLIEKYQDLTESNLMDIAEFIDSNSEAVGTIAKDVLSLNLVNDTFSSIGKFASQMIEDFLLEEGDDTKLGLNTDITDKNTIVDGLINAIDKLVDLNNELKKDELDISKLLASTDMLNSLTSLTDISAVLEKLGTALDTIREQPILILEGETTGEKVYVLDNILKLFNISLLGDTVYGDKTIEVDSYTDLFVTVLSEPIETAVSLGLLDSNASFESIFDNVLLGLKQNTSLLTDILMPFYQLQKASFNTTDTENPNLKSMVFDTIIEMLGTNASDILSVDKVPDNLVYWTNELDKLGLTLNLLNDGKVGPNEETYIKYILNSTSDTKLEDVMKEMLADKKLASVLEPVLSANIFSSLATNIFSQIDDTIGVVTGVNPATTIERLKTDTTERNHTIDVIEKLLEITLDENTDMTSLSVEQVGMILDILKTNAKGVTETVDDGLGGTTTRVIRGTFNSIFANIIWYMTGDSIDGKDYGTAQPIENYADIKEYLAIDTTNGYDGYYELNFAEKLYVFTFAQNVANALADEDIDADTVGFVEAFKAEVLAIDRATDAEKVEVVENLTRLVGINGEQILSEEDKQTYELTIKTAIGQDEDFSEEMKNALINLLFPTTQE